jgi:mono/diheme cytochrome c family protein
MKNTAKITVTAGILAIAASLSYAADVKENWTRHCGRCHGADGAGDTKAGKKLNVKDYTSADVQAKMTDADMLKAIVDGVKGDDGKDKMQSYKEKLSEQESKDLVAYIRTMKK